MFNCYANAESNFISQVLDDGKILVMGDGSIYKIYDYDSYDSNYWLPMTDVEITNSKIINIDDGESVEWERKIK